MTAAHVVVVGGTGFYGRYLVADLLRRPGLEVTVVARHRPAENVRFVRADREDVERLTRIVAGATALVHCAGPFQALGPSGVPPLGPLRAALAAGVPYVDISEDRTFRRAVLDVAQHAAVPVLSGASVVPGMEAIVVADLAAGLDRVDAVRCAAAPDTRRHRGRAMFAAMLNGAGVWFEAPQGASYGWSEPEWVVFPPPVGRRLVYQVYEMADLDLYPGVGTVSFKAGSEFATLNRLLALVATIRAHTGRPREPQRWTEAVRAVSWLAGRVGDEAGAFLVSVTGQRDGRTVTRSLGMSAARHGGRIPALLAGIAVDELRAGRLVTPGIVPLDGWLAPDRLYDALKERGVRLWRRACPVDLCRAAAGPDDDRRRCRTCRIQHRYPAEPAPCRIAAWLPPRLNKIDRTRP